MNYVSFLMLNLKNTGLQIGHLKSKIPFLFLHLSELLKVECWNHWSKRQSEKYVTSNTEPESQVHVICIGVLILGGGLDYIPRGLPLPILNLRNSD